MMSIGQKNNPVMNKDNLENQPVNFGTWLIQKKYKIILSLIFAIIPLSTEFNIALFKPVASEGIGITWLWEQIYYNPYQIANIVLIFTTFIVLARSTKLMSKENDKKDAIHEYVRSVFGDSSTLAKNTPSDLYNRLRISIEQFYFSWLAVWVVWLLIYILKLIFAIYKYNILPSSEITDISSWTAFRIECLLENSLNLTNSFIILFIYLVITTSTVNVGSLNKNNKSGSKIMHTGVCVFFLIGIGCFFTDLFSIFEEISPIRYNNIQFFIRLAVGIIGTISLMAVLGRLNTNFLNVPQWMMFSLYLYAAVQMFYPITYNNNYYHPHLKDIHIAESEKKENSSYHYVNVNDSSLLNKISYKESQESEKKLNKGVSTTALPTNYAIGLEPIFYFYALIGKICLCLVLCWVNKKNRFLFFLIHKANTLSDSEMMLRRFNKYYEGCS